MIFKNGAKLFLKLIIVSLMCLFVSMSISVLCTAAFTKNVGYEAYGVKSESDKRVHLYTYYTADGEDTQKAQFEEQGYQISTVGIRSSLTKTGNAVFLSVTQIICFVLLMSFVYSQLWTLGNKDIGAVKYTDAKEDKLKGLKIGLIANIPSTLIYLAIIFSQLFGNAKPFISIFRLCNYKYFAFVSLIIGKSTDSLSVLQYLLLALLLTIVPLIAFISYNIGYKDIVISEKIVYKKKARE